MPTTLKDTRAVANLIDDLHKELALFDAKIGFTLDGRYYEDSFSQSEADEIDSLRQRFVARRVSSVLADLRSFGVEVEEDSLPVVFRTYRRLVKNP